MVLTRVLATEEGGHEINPIQPAVPEMIISLIVLATLIACLAAGVWYTRDRRRQLDELAARVARLEAQAGAERTQ